MGAGAFLVIAAWLGWLARGHLALAWRGFLRPRSVDDNGELMGYRTAVGLALLSVAGLVTWMWLAGIGPPSPSIQPGEGMRMTFSARPAR